MNCIDAIDYTDQKAIIDGQVYRVAGEVFFSHDVDEEFYSDNEEFYLEKFTIDEIFKIVDDDYLPVNLKSKAGKELKEKINNSDDFYQTLTRYLYETMS